MDRASIRNGTKGALPSDVEEEILRAIAGVRYGSVEIVIHDSRVVQIESREKLRLGEEPGRTRQK